MEWRVHLSKNVLQFLDRNNIPTGDISDLVAKAIRKFQGEDENVEIGKLKGKWLGFYKIRMGRMRLVVSFDFNNLFAFVDNIDWRGNVYKK